MRVPTKREFLRFLAVEGWTDKDAASGRKTGDHLRFLFTTPAGERLYTRVSHGSKAYENPDLFKAILRDQLKITEQEFWLAVDKGIPPERPQPAASARTQHEGIDAKLVRNLITKVGLAPQDVARMARAEAVAAWNQWLLEHPEG